MVRKHHGNAEYFDRRVFPWTITDVSKKTILDNNLFYRLNLRRFDCLKSYFTHDNIKAKILFGLVSILEDVFPDFVL